MVVAEKISAIAMVTAVIATGLAIIGPYSWLRPMTELAFGAMVISLVSFAFRNA
jgi:hypothetical protein